MKFNLNTTKYVFVRTTSPDSEVHITLGPSRGLDRIEFLGEGLCSLDELQDLLRRVAAVALP